jgi:hypothetical protein
MRMVLPADCRFFTAIELCEKAAHLLGVNKGSGCFEDVLKGLIGK